MNQLIGSRQFSSVHLNVVFIPIMLTLYEFQLKLFVELEKKRKKDPPSLCCNNQTKLGQLLKGNRLRYITSHPHLLLTESWSWYRYIDRNILDLTTRTWIWHDSVFHWENKINDWLCKKFDCKVSKLCVERKCSSLTNKSFPLHPVSPDSVFL